MEEKKDGQKQKWWDPTGRYWTTKTEVLGKGSFKTVYKGFDTERGVEVAWNQIHQVDEAQPQWDEADPRSFSLKQTEAALKDSFSHEVFVAMNLHHPHLVNFLFSWVDEEETIHFVCELMSSGTLKEYIEKNEPGIKVIKQWCRQILAGLNYLHSRSPTVVHRDMKCDNIFINGASGEVKIGDLGLAVELHGSHLQAVVGTPVFMSSEMFKWHYTEKADVYAFGMCVLEMVSRESPYNECPTVAQTFQKVLAGIQPEALDRIADDSEIKKIILLCLEPEHRRPSAAELLHHEFFRESEDERTSVEAAGCIVGRARVISERGLSDSKEPDSESSRDDTKTAGEKTLPEDGQSYKLLVYLDDDPHGKRVDIVHKSMVATNLVAQICSKLLLKPSKYTALCHDAEFDVYVEFSDLSQLANNKGKIKLMPVFRNERSDSGSYNVPLPLVPPDLFPDDQRDDESADAFDDATPRPDIAGPSSENENAPARPDPTCLGGPDTTSATVIVHGDATPRTPFIDPSLFADENGERRSFLTTSPPRVLFKEASPPRACALFKGTSECEFSLALQRCDTADAAALAKKEATATMEATAEGAEAAEETVATEEADTTEKAAVENTSDVLTEVLADESASGTDENIYGDASVCIAVTEPCPSPSSGTSPRSPPPAAAAGVSAGAQLPKDAPATPSPRLKARVRAASEKNINSKTPTTGPLRTIQLTVASPNMVVKTEYHPSIPHTPVEEELHEDDA